VILDALTWYNLGYTLDDTRTKLKNRYGMSIAASSIAGWFNEHKDITSYRRLRPEGIWQFTPTQTVRAIKLYHRQVYHFAYHRTKLALLRKGREHRRLSSLADFIETIPTACPHALFHDGARASQLRVDAFHPSKVLVIERDNYATRTAAFVVPTVGDNVRRHETLQRFMLANDSVTLAVEVPIWLTASDIKEVEAEYAISLREPDDRSPITGHIDFLQVRNGAVHILDYKPNARGDRPIAQLAIYAVALSRLAGIRLFDIKCAWFDEHHYCEFFPRTLLSRKRDRRTA
jgi:ATP-dependent exoDNAse (exonuclease V) beta subunit